MNDTVRRCRDFFVSLKLTVVLLALGIILVFVATLDQVNLGIWAVQEKYFRSFFVLARVGDIPVPVFPGGYLLGGLLLLNLTAAHVARFQFTWKKAGIQLTHAGLILLLVGELLSGLLQEDFAMRLEEGQPKDFAESYRLNEVAIIDRTDPQHDEVVVIPEAIIGRGDPVRHAKLPFRVVIKSYYPNSRTQPKAQVPDPPPALATHGSLAGRYVVTPQPVTYKPDDRNLPAAAVELVGPEGPIGSWLLLTAVPVLERAPDGSSFVEWKEPPPQAFDYAGRQWRITLRAQRAYKPFTLTLLKFSHDRYAGTEIPRNFSSRVRLTTPDGQANREVLIYMNNPLRFAGLTFYQASFDRANPKVTILQVVRNPSWLLPYLACAVMSAGLVWQFAIHLAAFARQRRAAA
ncbi:MAG: cytochrome c biogenesis protein ResB [Verrucomicrobia bacterium]|nr:cytochrome c biogenesis protein ResB [Verrucomicrobiota bacterium]